MCAVVRKALVLVFVFCAVFSGLAEAAEMEKLSVGKQDIARMSIFLSNFTELGLNDIPDASKLAANKLIYFGIGHNYINNNKLVKKVSDTKMSIDAEFVKTSIKKYFAINIKNSDLKSVTYFQQNYVYDGKKYTFEDQDMDTSIYARVDEVFKTGKTLIMNGVLYKNDASKEVLGEFTARAKPWKHNGKDTWALLSFTTIK